MLVLLEATAKILTVIAGTSIVGPPTLSACLPCFVPLLALALVEVNLFANALSNLLNKISMFSF
jgi:hypothetical protein